MTPARLHPAPAEFRLDQARPEEAAARLAHLEGFVFLDTASAGFAPGTASAAGPPAGDLSLIAARPSRTIRGNLRDPGELRDALEEHRSRCAADIGMPLGGAFGRIEFDGSFRFGIYDELLIHHHPTNRWFLAGKESSLRAALAEPWPESPPDAGTRSALIPQYDLPRAAFIEAVQRAREYIAAGDIYQVNLSHVATAAWEPGRHDPFLLYQCLREHSPAPFAAYLRDEEKTVLSSSPELFLKISGDLAQTCPIKGTRPRYRDLARDEKSAYDLLTSPKEVAELIMITDLERNDLGKVCAYGSVHATELLKLERYAQVFHLVSSVQGTLRPGIDHLEALRACFPGGSISGAPKKRALEIIAELEPQPRGLYTGSIGYFGFNGESQFNIAIRTAVIEDDRLHFHVGAGIVADSSPGKEYQETLHKGSGILKAIDAYNQAGRG